MRGALNGCRRVAAGFGRRRGFSAATFAAKAASFPGGLGADVPPAACAVDFELQAAFGIAF